MLKHMKAAAIIGTVTLATLTTFSAAAQSPFPSSAVEFSSHFWTERMMRTIDSNKDGNVDRAELEAGFRVPMVR